MGLASLAPSHAPEPIPHSHRENPEFVPPSRVSRGTNRVISPRDPPFGSAFSRLDRNELAPLILRNPVSFRSRLDPVRPGLETCLRGGAPGGLADASTIGRETLLALLGEKIGRVPRAFGQAIRATSDRRRLDRWLKRIMHATTLDQMRIARNNGRG